MTDAETINFIVGLYSLGLCTIGVIITLFFLVLAKALSKMDKARNEYIDSLDDKQLRKWIGYRRKI